MALFLHRLLFQLFAKVKNFKLLSKDLSITPLPPTKNNNDNNK